MNNISPFNLTVMVVIFYMSLMMKETLAISADHNLFNNFNGNHNRRLRRQTSEQSFEECNRILISKVCPASGQNFINKLSGCGEKGRTAIDSVINGCSVDSNGDYCITFPTSTLSGYIFGNCSQSTCTNQCRSALSLAVQTAGCCYNATIYSTAVFFTTCGINLPSPCPGPSLRFPELSQSSSCSSNQDLSRIQVSSLCTYSRPFLSELAMESQCQDFAGNYSIYCSSRNDELCLTKLSFFENFTDSSFGLNAQSARENCPSTQNCTSQCSSSLNILKNNYGCCANAFNSTILFRPRLTIFENSLWIQCGITPPDFCNAGLKTFSNLAIILFTAFLVLYHITIPSQPCRSI